MFGKGNGGSKSDIRQKALAGMLKKGPMGPGAVKPKSMAPMMAELDGMQENASEGDDQEQMQGPEYMQFMVSPQEKDMILSMRKKGKMGSGGHGHGGGMGGHSMEG